MASDARFLDTTCIVTTILYGHGTGSRNPRCSADAQQSFSEGGWWQSFSATINTVLDRLHEKGMVMRVSVIGSGGTMYVYFPASSEVTCQRYEHSFYDNLEKIVK